MRCGDKYIRSRTTNKEGDGQTHKTRLVGALVPAIADGRLVHGIQKT